MLKMAVPVLFLSGVCGLVYGQSQQPASKSEPAAAPQRELIGSTSLEAVQKLLQGMGFECTRDHDVNGKLQNYLVFRAEGYKIVAKVPSPGYIWLFNIFTDKLPLEAVNEWNRTNNFSHAYIDKDGDLYFEADIIVHGGVTRENVEAQIKQFRDAVAKWARFVVDHVKADNSSRQ